MRLTLRVGVVVLALSACGTDEPTTQDGTQYATGQLPTADSVQRDSDVHVASSARREAPEEPQDEDAR